MADDFLVWYNTAGNFRWCKIFYESASRPSRIFFFRFYFSKTRAVQATPLPNDCHASFLTCPNLASPKSATVKIDVDNDKAKIQPATTMTESSFLVEAMAIIFARTFWKISGLVRFFQFFFVCSCQSICKNHKKISAQQKLPAIAYFALAVKKCLSDDMRWSREKLKAGNHWELKPGRLVWAGSALTTERHVQTTEQPPALTIPYLHMYCTDGTECFSCNSCQPPSVYWPLLEVN